MKVKGNYVATTGNTMKDALRVLSVLRPFTVRSSWGRLKATHVVQGERVTDRRSEVEQYQE